MPLLSRVPRILRVGTDFSGMDTPLTALSHILAGGSPRVRHVFSSDSTNGCRKYIRLIHPACEQLYEDVVDRDPKTTTAVDLYCWGPPCQSFSIAGKNLGIRDERGQLPKYSLKYIKAHKPRLTIMETQPPPPPPPPRPPQPPPPPPSPPPPPPLPTRRMCMV